MGMLASYIEDAIVNKGIDSYKSYVETVMDENEAKKMDEKLMCHECVVEGVSSANDHIWNANSADQMSTIYAMHPGEVEIRGVKDGMKGEKRNLDDTHGFSRSFWSRWAVCRMYSMQISQGHNA